MAETTDKLMDMVDALIAQIEAAKADEESSPFSLAFDAEWSDDLNAVLSDPTLLVPQLWVIDSGESLLPAWESSASQQGCPVEEFELLLVVQKKLSKDTDRKTQCRQLSALVAELTRFCRKTTILDATCIRTKRDPARNWEVYSADNLYRAAVSTTWHRIYGDDSDE